MAVTESLAMTPAASVSGFYIGHPDATYFNVGKISDDQVQDLAQRRNLNQCRAAAPAGTQFVIFNRCNCSGPDWPRVAALPSVTKQIPPSPMGCVPSRLVER